MQMKTLFTVLVGAVSLSGAAFAAGSPMQDGLWEITTTMNMPASAWHLARRVLRFPAKAYQPSGSGTSTVAPAGASNTSAGARNQTGRRNRNSASRSLAN